MSRSICSRFEVAQILATSFRKLLGEKCRELRFRRWLSGRRKRFCSTIPAHLPLIHPGKTRMV